MNKLNANTRFSKARPTIDIQRSTFDLSHGHHMTMNAGLLYPFFNREVLPGDTYDFSDAFVNRMSSPLKTPIMDTAVFDQWLFYVPYRLVWEHTKQFYGENNVSAWTPQAEYFMPKLTHNFKPDGVGDNMGIPTLKQLSVNVLRLRAYRLIWNEWFRDQNTQSPKLVNLGDVETDKTLDDLLPVNKRKDYFTTCLPEPQKGPDVLLPLTGDAVVKTASHRLFEGDGVFAPGLFPLSWSGVGSGVDYTGYQYLSATAAPDNELGDTMLFEQPASGPGSSVAPDNLYADLSSVTGATINQLRQAFAVQALYEVDARSGSRYREFLKAHFHTNVPDLTVQVPEFLGGQSTPINVNQVVQSSSTLQDVSAQGHVTGFSKTVGQGASFVKSFTEPGYVIGVCAIRTLHTYQQGLDRSWSRFSRLDYYHPVLASIGEQPVFNKELYVYGDDGDEVFGYQEAWGDYRFAQSYVSGAFRSNYPHGSLDFWTYTDDFEDTPRLSDEWMRETDVNVGRSLATANMEGAPQFIVDFWFNLKVTSAMPAFGTPAMLGGRQ